jgi:hypothetical protein
MRELSIREQLESLAFMTQIVEAFGDVGLGVGVAGAGVSATVYVCAQTALLGCAAVAIELVPVSVVGGYEISRAGLNELKEIFVKDEDCK